CPQPPELVSRSLPMPTRRASDDKAALCPAQRRNALAACWAGFECVDMLELDEQGLITALRIFYDTVTARPHSNARSAVPGSQRAGELTDPEHSHALGLAENRASADAGVPQ